MRPAATMNAPTEAEKPPATGPVAMSSAAPGVDQTMLIGCRQERPYTKAKRPWTMQTMKRPEAPCSGDAPTACSP